MITITREFGIDYGHRLLKHEGKCRHVHGHRGTIEITLTAPTLDDVGRILDFSEIKTRIGGWLDDNWDHGFIAQEGDPLVLWLKDAGMKHRVYAFPPTAENLVAFLAGVVKELLPDFGVTRVTLYETPNCKAEWSA